MADATTNAQRAMTFMYEERCQGNARAGFADSAQRLERMLNEAEDRGARQPMPADADTVEALKRLVREMLDPLRESMVPIPPAAGEILDARAAGLVQMLIGNFHMRLMNEDDEAVDATGSVPR